MTKERLEELIKQGAKVFYVNAYRTVMELEFKDKIYAHNDFYLWYGKIPYEIRTLYETKKQAEWHLKTYATRTERFEPTGKKYFGLSIRYNDNKFLLRLAKKI